MLMRSPPISRPIDARSSVEATTFSLFCADNDTAPSARAAAATNHSFLPIALSSSTANCNYNVTTHALERMRSMRADRELKLEQKLVRLRSGRIRRPAVLAPHLAE